MRPHARCPQRGRGRRSPERARRELRLRGCPSLLHAGDERPDLRHVHLFNRLRPKLRLRQEGRQIEIRLEADVNGERRDGTLDAREDRIGAAEVIQDDDLSTWLADAPHLAGDHHWIGHDADQIWGVDDVERIVSEGGFRRVHLDEPDVAEALAGDALARLVEHRRREVIPGDVTVARIERGVDACADADFEDMAPWPDFHPVARDEASRVERRTEDQVVDARQLFIDAFDEVIFNGDNGQRAGSNVAPEISLFSLEQRHSLSMEASHQWLRDYTIHWSSRR